MEPLETGQEPVKLVPEPPLSRTSVVVDPLVPEEELVVLEPLVEPVVLEPLVEPVVLEPLVKPEVVPESFDEPAETNLTASAQVDLALELDSMTTLACPEKL